MGDTTLLVALPFLQQWSGSKLTVNVLLLPRKTPLKPLITGAPPFATANFKLTIHIQSGTEQLPISGTANYATESIPIVPTAEPVLKSLVTLFPVDPAAGGATRDVTNRVRKYAPLTYQEIAGSAPRRPGLLVTDRSYGCAINYKRRPYRPLPPNPIMSWGKIFAICLRNYDLAKAAGLIRRLSIDISDLTILKNGGYLWVTLASDGDGGGLMDIPGGFKTYAARIPHLAAARDLFTPLLLPVTSEPTSLDYDEIFSELADYDDGWAKAVHCTQPRQMDPLSEKHDGSRPVKEVGILLGWDDEQVTAWMHRQMAPDPLKFDSPLGVQGYRVDVRVAGDASWISLAKASGPLSVPGVQLGPFDGELHVEVHPTQPDGIKTGDFWLPMYMTAWVGGSLVSMDLDRLRLAGIENPTPLQIQGINPGISLLYGKTYEFRVRFMDQTGGGPDVLSSPRIQGPSPIASQLFQRWICPLRPRVEEDVEDETGQADPANPPAKLTIYRPLLHSPAVLCTGAYTDPMASLLQDIPVSKTEHREPGLPDPDVDRVYIIVEVKALRQDPIAPDGFMQIMDTTRSFPQDRKAPLILDLNWQEVHNASLLSSPAAGPLSLPRARLVRLRISSLCRDEPQLVYFGSQDVRSGPPVEVLMRMDSTGESDLLIPIEPSKTFCALYMQPDHPVDPVSSDAQSAAGTVIEKPPDIGSRISTALEIPNDDLSFHARPGRRIVFACSSSLHYVIGPDRASITFSSQSDLALRWLVVIKLTLNRDWSWDGLSQITLERDSVTVETLTLPGDVNSDALKFPDRSQTDLVLIDAIDPRPADGDLPRELYVKYRVSWTYQGTAAAAPPPLDFEIDLPVTTPPPQLPKIASAGIALSEYNRAPDYSTSEPRRRVLWIELAEPVKDHRDAYFGRVLAYAPDPLLAGTSFDATPKLEALLPIDPEPVRRIVQGQSNDSAGLSAMQRLIPSSDPLHWALPLPPGMNENSPELFGLFTYELRVGHANNIWSTAQGRFGPPVRVVGLQHPPPPLLCTVLRTATFILVSAPFALPINNRRITLPKNLASAIWVMLYAQATQMDGADRRNVLIATAPAIGIPHHAVSPVGEAVFDLERDVFPVLEALGLSRKAPLSVLAVELMPQGDPQRIRVEKPLTRDLGLQRILRSSNLEMVPGTCP
ncbi:MAG: hypothetical protein M1839_005610 [Geoglossum umbratile]|nr:MAG: hypothetical protein M1839_005610 [Geoglossum umbratile]